MKVSAYCQFPGPTILFERDGERFFTCSAYRSRNLCPFYLPETKWKPCQEVEIAESGASRKRRTEKEKSKSNKKPKMERSFNVDNPLLMPNQRDQGEAQYHFNELTVNFFMEQLEILGIDHVLCVGTPSLHEHIVKSGKEGKGNVRSYLLDIDQRFVRIKKIFCLWIVRRDIFRTYAVFLNFRKNCTRTDLVCIICAIIIFSKVPQTIQNF